MIRDRLPTGVAGRDMTLVVAVGVGLLAVGVAVVVGLAVDPTPDRRTTAAGVIAVLVGLVAAVWKLLRSPDDDDVEPAPWTGAGALVGRAPERTPADLPVSGTALSETIERAASAARNERTVDEGLAELRPHLRRALLDALVQGGVDEATARRRLATGAWTDDREAAAVLDEQVTPPRRSLRRRVWVWLYPERAVRRRAGRATAAVARAADEALPPVVGQDAPRTIPVVVPSVEELTAGDEQDRYAVATGDTVDAPDRGDRSGAAQSADEGRRPSDGTDGDDTGAGSEAPGWPVEGASD